MQFTQAMDFYQKTHFLLISASKTTLFLSAQAVKRLTQWDQNRAQKS